MKHLALENLATFVGLCAGCLFFSAISTTLVFYTSSPNPKVHWSGIFWGGFFGLLLGNTIVIPAIGRFMAKLRIARDQSHESDNPDQ
jgi:hypothetical protein